MLTKPLSGKQSSSLIALEPLQLLSGGRLVSRSFSTSQDCQSITESSRPQRPLSSGSFRLKLSTPGGFSGAHGPRTQASCGSASSSSSSSASYPPPSTSQLLSKLRNPPWLPDPRCATLFLPARNLPSHPRATASLGYKFLPFQAAPLFILTHPHLCDYLIEIRLLYPHSCLCHEVPCRHKDQIQPHNHLQVGPLSSVHSQMRKLRLPECQWLALGLWGSQW